MVEPVFGKFYEKARHDVDLFQFPWLICRNCCHNQAGNGPTLDGEERHTVRPLWGQISKGLHLFIGV